MRDRTIEYENRKRRLRTDPEYALKVKEQARVQRERHAQKRAEYNKEWVRKKREEDPNWRKQYHQEYNATERRRELNRQYEARRRADAIPQRQIAVRLRARINKVASGYLITSRRLENLIGCSVPRFMNYLERHFQDGMTWENRHLWHIDHKIPCIRFDLSDPDQQKRCFHWSNLRPLWAEDNLAKGTKERRKE